MGCFALSATIPVLAASFPGSVFRAEIKDHKGRVEGTVILSSPAGKRAPLPVFKSRDFCGRTIADETLIVARDGGLENAAVLLHPLGAEPMARPGTLTLDNRHCRFKPHEQVGALGSELLLKNSDPILHTAHARLGTETLFNVGLPTWRGVRKKLDRAGVIRFNWDVLHTWISAPIVVTNTPYHAITDGAGRFRIDGVPAGHYEMDTWHERLGWRRMTVSIIANGVRSVEVIYSEAKIR